MKRIFINNKFLLYLLKHKKIKVLSEEYILLVFLILIFLLIYRSTAIAQSDAISSDFHKSLDSEMNTKTDDEGKSPEVKTDKIEMQKSLESPTIKKGGSNRLSVLSSIFVREIKWEGNTVYDPNVLAKITKPYTDPNKKITFEKLDELRRKLTLKYIDDGYINSGAIIPDQAVENGIIKIQIIEGVLNKIEIKGAKYFKKRYIRDRLMLAAGRPLNKNDIHEALQLLHQDNRIKSIKAKLKPGLIPGESILDVEVIEEKPYEVILETNNNLSPNVGDVCGELLLAHNNFTGNGDILNGRFKFAEGLNDLDTSYALPFNPRGTSLKLGFRKSNSTVIEDLFKDLDIKSDSKTYAVTISHPYHWTPEKKYSLLFSLELRESRSSLLGIPFSFSPGAEDGKSNLTVFRFSQEWVNRSQNQVIAGRSTFSIGLDAFNATVNDLGEDSRFICWLGQAQWIRRVKFLESQVVLRTDIQLADNPLLPLEKFAVGGMDTVRGYRENQLVRDNGIVSSIEYRIPVLRYKHGGLLQLISFYDFGRSWNKGSTTPDPEPHSISSVGLGINWAIINKLNLQVHAGLPLRNILNSGNNLQDDGIHFRFKFVAL